MTENHESNLLVDILTPIKVVKQCNFSKLSLSQKNRKRRGMVLKDSINLGKESLPCSQPITPTTKLNDNDNQIDDSITMTCPSTSTYLKSLSKSTEIGLQNENLNENNETVPPAIQCIEELGEFTSEIKVNEKDLCSNSVDSKIPLLKIRSITELMSPSKINKSLLAKENNVDEKTEQNLQEFDNGDVVIISSEDEDEFETKMNSEINCNKPETRKKRSNTDNNVKQKKKRKKSTKEEIQIKSEIDKITVQRRLTKSTNLKRITAKYIPENQQKIDDFFKAIPNDKKTVKYFDTFEKTKPETDNITEQQPTDYLQIVMGQMERMVENNPKIQELSDVIDLTLNNDENEAQNDNENEVITHNNDNRNGKNFESNVNGSQNNERQQQQKQECSKNSNKSNKSINSSEAQNDNENEIITQNNDNRNGKNFDSNVNGSQNNERQQQQKQECSQNSNKSNKSINSSDTSLMSQFYSTKKNYETINLKNKKEDIKISCTTNKQHQEFEVPSLNEYEMKNTTDSRARNKRHSPETEVTISDISRRASDTVTLEFSYKSLPSEKTESVDYAPKNLPTLRRSRRLNTVGGKPSSVTTDTTSTTLTKKNEKNQETKSEKSKPIDDEETIKKSKRINKKILAKISKSKVRKKLNFKVNSNVQDNEDDLFQTNSDSGLNSFEIETFESNKLNSSTPISKKNKKLEENLNIITIEDSPPFKKQKKVEKNKKSISVSQSYGKNLTMTKTMSSIINRIDENDENDENDNDINSPLPSMSTTMKKNLKAKTTGGKMMKNKRNKTNIRCPDYKIIKGTTFAVDAFRFGYIEGVTHYFLTHFHADHYIGLKKSFEMPIYGSEITIRLIETMIGVDKKYLNVIKINEHICINDIEITALDANHCPGAIMLHFKLKNDYDKCILHTGDFRASPNMESEPIFWNNTMHTIYLDTTYLSHRYEFKPQYDSINDAEICVENFYKNHIGERILIVCGSYVVGKEKVWMAIAEKFDLTVWMDGNRKKTLQAINDENMLKYLNENPCRAGIHVLTMNKLTYDYLWQYLNQFSDHYDVLLALRPSGWEKNSKPQYRGRVNIVGIEYSEHSSYNELRRFVRFLQPTEIISTVPYSGGNLSKTTKIPKSWFQNDVKNRQIGYQSSITNYLKFDNNNSSINGKSKSTKIVPLSSSSSIIISNKRKRHKNGYNNIIYSQSDDELIEQDGIILDATRSNLTQSSKSPRKTPKKNGRLNYSQNVITTPTTTVTDWMS